MSNPKDLDEKVDLLLNELEQVDRKSAAILIKNFVKSQLDWNEVEHTIDEFDLETVRSYAIKEMTDLPINTLTAPELTQGRHQALAYMQAFLSHFRSKGLIPFTFKYKKKGKGYV